MGKIEADPLINGDGMLRELIGDWRNYLLKEVVMSRPAGAEAFFKKLEKRFCCTPGRSFKILHQCAESP